MKNILILMIALLIFNDSYGRYELMIKNYSADSSIYVRIFPFGAIFNGRYEYSLSCRYPSSIYDKIFGGDTILQ